VRSGSPRHGAVETAGPGTAGIRALALAALLLATGAPARGVCPVTTFNYLPSYEGSFSAYGHRTAFGDPLGGGQVVKASTARICSGCTEPRRGIRLTARKEFGGGVFQVPVALGPSFCLSGLLDLSGASGPGALVGLEIDSPAVEVDVVPELYVFAGVREDGGVRNVFVEVSGAAVGTTLALPPEAQTVEIDLHYGGGTVDVNARIVPGGGLTALVTDQPFAWAGSASVAASTFELAKNDRMGFALALSGSIHSAVVQQVLEELYTLVPLEVAALADIDASQTADARAKLEAARLRLVEQGPAIPGSDPPAFEPPLVDVVRALPNAKAARSAARRLQKAGKLDERARDQLDLAKPEAAEKARALAEKALAAMRAAGRIVETGVPAEG
jgi:hypothetical protein